ncbi:uncharacterized protein LOC131604988 [Vicia villosa]|uniref:uncharacterized protein LOC131604988 n=1 Tax=Vicia villosa TaxID=3911 RepID=UPI00273CC04F|nr:uncharacterized protein LOC131604988 [Vicia villosa]
MTERKMIDMFTSTLSGHYYLACSASANFFEMVRYGERVEIGLKMGKIQLRASSNTSSGKKQVEGYARRKEGNVDAIYGRKGQGRNNPQVNVVFIPVPQQQQQHQQGQRSNNNRYPPRTRPHRNFDVIPMTYSQLLQHMLKIGKITLRDAPNAPDTQSPNYNANTRCAFHSGVAGHDTERCIALKTKVQDLLDQNVIQFTPTPNNVNNTMSTHGGGAGVNAIEDEGISVVSDVGRLTFPLMSVKQHLVNSGIFPGCGVDCRNCKNQREGCTDLKEMVQRLIDEGPLQFYRKRGKERFANDEVVVIDIPYDPVAPICIQVHVQIPIIIPYAEQPAALMIIVPGPIPYESEKAIPWHYGSDMYYYGTKKEGPSKEKFVETAIANANNVTGTDRITRSGRVFSPQSVQNNADALAKARDKQVVTDSQNSPIQNGANNNSVSSKDVEELIRIIRRSDYKVVE